MKDRRDDPVQRQSDEKWSGYRHDLDASDGCVPAMDPSNDQWSRHYRDEDHSNQGRIEKDVTDDWPRQRNERHAPEEWQSLRPDRNNHRRHACKRSQSRKENWI